MIKINSHKGNAFSKLMYIIILIMIVMPIDTVLVPYVNAESEKIDSVEDARKIAENSDGIFSEGDSAPTFKGDLVVLPVKDEETGKTLGYIVAEKNKLVSALIIAGHTKVATVIADSEEKNIKKVKGISKWTIAGGLALAVGGIAAISSGGGSGGGGSGEVIDIGSSSGNSNGTGDGSTDVPVPIQNWSSWSIPDNPAPLQDFAVFVDINASGVEVFYEITGSDLFKTSGQRISGANGQVSIIVPGVAQGVLTTVTAWVPAWGPQYTKTWMF